MWSKKLLASGEGLEFLFLKPGVCISLLELELGNEKKMTGELVNSLLSLHGNPSLLVGYLLPLVVCPESFTGFILYVTLKHLAYASMVS